MVLVPVVGWQQFSRVCSVLVKTTILMVIGKNNCIKKH